MFDVYQRFVFSNVLMELYTEIFVVYLWKEPIEVEIYCVFKNKSIVSIYIIDYLSSKFYSLVINLIW